MYMQQMMNSHMILKAKFGTRKQGEVSLLCMRGRDWGKTPTNSCSKHSPQVQRRVPPERWAGQHIPHLYPICLCPGCTYLSFCFSCNMCIFCSLLGSFQHAALLTLVLLVSSLWGLEEQCVLLQFPDLSPSFRRVHIWNTLQLRRLRKRERLFVL